MKTFKVLIFSLGTTLICFMPLLGKGGFGSLRGKNKKKKVKGEMLSSLYSRLLPGTLLLVAVLVISLPGQLLAEVSDGANGGNEHFFFLPPLVPAPSPTGTFAGSMDPVVQICEWTGTDCVFPPIAEFTTTTGPGSEMVRVVPEDEHYIINWHPRGLDQTKTYRVSVLYRIQEEGIEKELGHVDVTVSSRTIPIKFRIEEGFFPIGELTPMERIKISPVLLEQFISQDLIEPVEVLVNVFDDQIPLPELMGVEILRDYRPTLAKAFVRISNPATLASLVQADNIKYVYENRKWYLLAEPWQETIGQNLVQQSGYLGTGTAVVILDDGGREIGFLGGRIPNKGVIDLSDPAFGGCTGVGTPASCRVVAEVNPMSGDPHIDNHATYVAKRFALTAPGADIIGYDVVFDYSVPGHEFSQALKWVLDHQNEYNIVAINMSFGTDANGSDPAGPYSTEDCPKGDDDAFQRLRQAGIIPIAGAGNDGSWQTNNDAFYGISHPACSPFVVSVGGSDESEIWTFGEGSTRGPNLDFLAPACGDGGCGTSIAAPTGSGTWTILRAALPALSLDETLDLLKTTGTPIFDPESGLTFPRIQLDAALQAAGLPVVEVACPCFTADYLNAVEWDIWCSGTTLEYLLDNASSGDPGPIVEANPGGGTPTCSTGSFYDSVVQEISQAEAEACVTLIVATGTNQGTERACRID
jgi:hypothetical protein